MRLPTTRLYLQCNHRSYFMSTSTKRKANRNVYPLTVPTEYKETFHELHDSSGNGVECSIEENPFQLRNGHSNDVSIARSSQESQISHRVGSVLR